MKIKTIDLNKRTKNEFNENIGNGDAIVLVHADWCPHCHDFLPHWNNALNQFRGMNVPNMSMLGTVEEKNLGNSEMCQDVRGYPTVMTFKGGKRKRDYKGPMNLNGITKFIKKTFNLALKGGKLPCGCPDKPPHGDGPGPDAKGKDKRGGGKRRKKKGSGNEQPQEKKLEHPQLNRPRVTTRRRNPTRRPDVGGRKRRRTRKRRRGSGKKQNEIDKVWNAFKKGRAAAKHREYMKKNPLPKMSVKEAFKQSNLPKTEVNITTDEKVKELERKLMKATEGRYVEGKTVTKYPKRAGKRRRTRRRKTRKRRSRKKRRSRRRKY